MRIKLLLQIPLLLLGSMVFGQEKDIMKDGNYYFKNISRNVTEKLASNAGSYTTEVKDEILNMLEGTSYNIKVTKIEDDYVYFVFGSFDKSEKEKLINTQKNDKSHDSLNFKNHHGEKNIQYYLPKDVLSNNVGILYNRVEYRVGVFTVPYKLRLSSFSFDANVNLGANLGVKIRWNRRIENGFSIEPIFGVGLASIKLDKDNSLSTEPTNVSAFTINTGVLLHLTSVINVGMTYGFDNISQNDQNNYRWKYQGKGWLGIGINVSFGNQGSNTGNLNGN